MDNFVNDNTCDAAMPCLDLDNAIQTLRENERYLRSVADSALNAVISTDNQGRITFANKAVKSIFRYAIREVMVKSITLLIPERFVGKHLSGME